MKLRKCTCGGTPEMYYGLNGEELRHVFCTECHYSTIFYWNGNDAASCWNSLIKQKKEVRGDI